MLLMTVSRINVILNVHYDDKHAIHLQLLVVCDRLRTQPDFVVLSYEKTFMQNSVGTLVAYPKTIGRSALAAVSCVFG